MCLSFCKFSAASYTERMKCVLMTQTSLKHLNVTHVTTDTSTASAFLTGFALISVTRAPWSSPWLRELDSKVDVHVKNAKHHTKSSDKVV